MKNILLSIRGTPVLAMAVAEAIVGVSRWKMFRNHSKRYNAVKGETD